jgi:2',3'-cyclic-nucleotide 2'-phosphodiesterase (5'-nucleotidase family)
LRWPVQQYRWLPRHWTVQRVESRAKTCSKKAVKNGKANIVTILHTADIHAQLLTHDELFIENGKPVYKKRGGYAVLKTMINELRAQNPANTMLIDGGDCFQGSGIAALSKGTAIVPLMNYLNYDLILPGNWEVVYGKEIMLKTWPDTGQTKFARTCIIRHPETRKVISSFHPTS